MIAKEITLTTPQALLPAHRVALDSLGGQWAVLLTTYRGDGTPVSTPVNIVLDGDRALIRTYEQAWKFKRIRSRPEVDVAPSTWWGAPTGPAIPARARILEGAESERAGRLIDRKYPVFQRALVRLGHRLLRYRTAHLELSAIDG